MNPRSETAAAIIEYKRELQGFIPGTGAAGLYANQHMHGRSLQSFQPQPVPLQVRCPFCNALMYLPQNFLKVDGSWRSTSRPLVHHRDVPCNCDFRPHATS